MKKAKNGGYSLVEVLVAIALLAIITIPTYTSLTLSVKINAKTDEMLKAQLAVSSAVETLMAEKLNVTQNDNGTYTIRNDHADDVTVECAGPTAEGSTTYKVTITSTADNSVSVTTYIPAKEGNGT